MPRERLPATHRAKGGERRDGWLAFLPATVGRRDALGAALLELARRVVGAMRFGQLARIVRIHQLGWIGQ